MGVPVIFTRQAAPRPKPPYGTLQFLAPSSREGSIDELRYDEEEDAFFQSGSRIFTATLNCYGEGANQKMANLRDSLDRPDVVEEFGLAGLAHVSEDGPNDLSELEETVYRERSQMDLELRGTLDREAENVGAIESAEIVFKDAPGGDQTIVVEETEGE
jgi:hypothetical protein